MDAFHTKYFPTTTNQMIDAAMTDEINRKAAEVLWRRWYEGYSISSLKDALDCVLMEYSASFLDWGRIEGTPELLQLPGGRRLVRWTDRVSNDPSVWRVDQ